jgi:hypothetical protein
MPNSIMEETMSINSSMTINIGQVFSFNFQGDLYKGEEIVVHFTDGPYKGSTGFATVLSVGNGIASARRIA